MQLPQESHPQEGIQNSIDTILSHVQESEYFIDHIFRYFGKRVGSAFLSIMNYGSLSASEYKVISKVDSDMFRVFFEELDFGEIALDTGIATTLQQQSLMALQFKSEIISHITRYQIFDDFQNDNFGEKYAQIAGGPKFKVFQSLSDGKLYLKLGNDFIPEEILTNVVNDTPEYLYFPGVDCMYIYSHKTGEILELLGELEEVYKIPSGTILQVVSPNGDAPKKRKLYFVEQDITHTLNLVKGYGEIHDVIEQDGRIYYIQGSLCTYAGLTGGKQAKKTERIVRVVDIISGEIVSETPGYYSKTTTFEDVTIIETLQRNLNPESEKDNEFTIHLTKLSAKGGELLPPLTDYKEINTDNDQIFIITMGGNKLILSFITMVIEPYTNIIEIHELDNGVMIEFTRGDGKKHFFRSKEFLEQNG